VTHTTTTTFSEKHGKWAATFADGRQDCLTALEHTPEEAKDMLEWYASIPPSVQAPKKTPKGGAVNKAARPRKDG